MRIHAPSPLGTAAVTSAVRRTAREGFSVAAEEEPRAATAGSGLRTLGSLDALIALQAVDTPEERRKRALGRGRTSLDALDELKLGLLAGALDTAALRRLKAVVGGLAEPSGDTRLDGVLAEIALRAEVELAKFARTSGTQGP
jgi:hypothetical protein